MSVDTRQRDRTVEPAGDLGGEKPHRPATSSPPSVSGSLTRRLRVRSLLPRLIALMVGTGCALVFAEVALRLLYPPYTHFYVWPPGTAMVFRPLRSVLPDASGPSHFTINSQGVRGRELPAGDAYRILAVGGSSTECLYLDDTKAWPALLEKLLQRSIAPREVWVGNVGKSGMNSRDHVLHIKYLPREYPGIDAIVLLVGVNDLTVALSQGNHYAPPPPLTAAGAEALQIRRAFAIAPGSLTRPATDSLSLLDAPSYKRTAVYQLLKRARAAVKDGMSKRGLIQDESGQALLTWRDHRRHAARILEEPPDLGPALKEYATNLDRIVGLARAQSIRLVLMTQPTLWRADLDRSAQESLWLGGIGDFQLQSGEPYYSAAVLAEVMRRFNDVLLDVCRVDRAECFDLAARIPKDTTVFYDDVHFTEHGAQVVAEEVATYLRGRPPLAPETAKPGPSLRTRAANDLRHTARVGEPGEGCRPRDVRGDLSQGGRACGRR
jgi:lysophospholipase L1-like esterase